MTGRPDRFANSNIAFDSFNLLLKLGPRGLYIKITGKSVTGFFYNFCQS